MKNPPSGIFGVQHSTFLACLALYIILSCAPVSTYKDPAAGPEVTAEEINAAIAEALSGTDVESTFRLGDRVLLNLNSKYFERTYVQAHYTREIIYKDNCLAVEEEVTQETNEVSRTGYEFGKAECETQTQPLELPLNTVSAKQLDWRKSSWFLIQRLNETAQTQLNARSTAQVFTNEEEEPTSHFYGLSAVKFKKKTANCSQFDKCVVEFTRIEYDRIIHPHDPGKRQRYHHYYELSTQVPYIALPYTECVSTLMKQDDGNKFPITSCLEVSDFLIGSGQQ